MVKTELYRVVLSFEYANGPLVAESRARNKEQIMRLWEWHIASGDFTPDSHVRARVMSDREYQRLGATGRFTRRPVVEGPKL